LSDLELDRAYQRNDSGPKVKLIQEWLSLDGVQVTPDGSFGPATELAVRQFQTTVGLTPDGVVGPLTFARLIKPMTDALAPIAVTTQAVGQLMVLYALQHLKQRPREVGGQNRGPWVRLYMNGNEGDQWAWCAGFACFVLRQACEALHIPLPLTASFSCDSLAASAQQHGIFLPGAPGMDTTKLAGGSLFLIRRTATDWTHTGIVTQVAAETIQTIEGNTNDDGSREGYEVCNRIRGYDAKDFILIR
jgi:hypothetical protein